MIEMYGPIPLTPLQWWDRQLTIGWAWYVGTVNGLHRNWQEMVGLR